MVFSDTFAIDDRDFCSPLEEAAWQVKVNLADSEWTQFVEQASQIFRDYADDLYERLEEEYNHLTSDEHVLESLLLNDILEKELEQYERCCLQQDDEGQDEAPV